MSPILTTTYLDEQLALDATESGSSGPFIPPATNRIFAFRGDFNIFQDNSGSVPVTATGQTIMTWGDLTWVHGSTTAPVLANHGGWNNPLAYVADLGPGTVFLDAAAFDFFHAVSLNPQDCCLFASGWFNTDTSQASSFYFMLGNIYAAGMAVATFGQHTSPPFGIQNVFNASDLGQVGGLVDADIAPCVFTLRSRPSGRSVRVNGVDSTAFAAFPSTTGEGIIIIGSEGSQPAAPKLSFYRQYCGYSPCPDDATIAAIEAGLAADMVGLTPWPRTQPVLGFVGDSLMNGTQFIGGGTVRTQGMPWQLMNSLTTQVGHVLAGMTGGTTGDLLAWYCATTPAPLTRAFSASRTAPQVAILLIGTNDLSQAIGSATIFANIKLLCATLRSTGVKLAVCSTWKAQGDSGTIVTERLNLRNDLATDFPNATTASRVFTAGTGITYADYFLDFYNNPQLDPVAHPANYDAGAGGPHLSPAGYAFPAADMKAFLALPAINLT